MSLFDQPGPRRDHPPRLPRRTADRLPQPRAGGRTRPQTRRTAAATDKLPGPDRAAVEAGAPRRRRRDRHQGRSARSPTNTRWASTSTSRSPTPLSPTTATRPASTPKPPSTASTCCAPASPATARPRRRGRRYKNLANVERDFRIIKTDDLDLRPIHHRLEDRVRAHVLICMLACYLTWHLRKPGRPLTFTDQHPPQRDNPVAPAHRSADAATKAAHKTRPTRLPVHNYHGPARPPGHPHPQPNPLPQHRHHRAHTHRGHPHPTPSIRTPRHPHPPHPPVARTHHPENHEPPAQPGVRPISAP